MSLSIDTNSKASIRPLDTQSAQRLSSDQVIRDLGSAVKELVENSLDACARSVEIRFRNHGLDLIEVIDDGNGIATNDIELIGRRHHTSKLRQFTDLSQVLSFGFRGEALASLCAVSGKVQLTTATPNDAPRGTRVIFDHQGSIVERSSVARTRGTTVTVEGLLSRLPVRQAEFKRNAKREFARAYRWLQSYAIISEGVKLTVRHPMGQGIMLSTDGSSDMLGNISQVYGLGQTKELLAVDFAFNKAAKAEKEGETDAATSDKNQQCKITGYLSCGEPGCGRSSGDRQLLYLNRRPIHLPKMIKMLNDVYRTLNIQPVPVAFLNIQLAPDRYDVNVTPDKRTVMIHHEASIIAQFKEYLSELYQPSQRTFTVQSSLLGHFSSSFEIVEEPQSNKEQEANASSPILSLRSLSTEANNPLDLLSSSSETAMDFQAKDISHILQEEELIDSNPGIVNDTTSKKSNYIVENKGQTTLETFLNRGGYALERRENTEYQNAPESALAQHISQRCSQSLSEHVTQLINKTDQETTNDNVTTNDAVKRKRSVSPVDALLVASSKRRPHLQNLTMTTMFSAEACRLYHEQLKDNCKHSSGDGGKHISNPITSLVRQRQILQNEAGLTSDAVTAEQALSRVVKKEDFYRMEILGQFNHGFILVLLPDATQSKEDTQLSSRRQHGDLFIIDQHAADEKWWPRILDVSESERVAIVEHLNVFQRNGYTIEVNDQGEPMMIAQPVGADAITGETSIL
ncbi:hypothetical protein BDF22DRAFT_668709 [Syncephalis plumigaleata]|nr:hypothetical protein BDF22DRAFT_668709 [Syncephalis plumigaleata]